MPGSWRSARMSLRTSPRNMARLMHPCVSAARHFALVGRRVVRPACWPAAGLAAAVRRSGRGRPLVTAARRLPGHRDAGVRRNHPRDHPEHRSRRRRERDTPACRITRRSSGSYTVAAITIYVVVSLIDSTYGRGFLTVRDDEVAAEAMGINTTKYKVIAFVMGAFFAGDRGRSVRANDHLHQSWPGLISNAPSKSSSSSSSAGWATRRAWCLRRFS